MAQKTLIGGTGYEITGGRTLVGGTGYSISGGRTLVGGTGYSINFPVEATSQNIWSSTTGTSNITFSEYLNGYYILGGQYKNSNSSNTYAMLAYSTKPTGPWTTIDLGKGGVFGIGYVGGYYVIGGNFSTAAKIKYSTTINGTWTDVELKTYATTPSRYTGTPKMTAFHCANGYCVAACSAVGYSDSDLEDRSADYSIALSTTNPTGTWSCAVIKSDNVISAESYPVTTHGLTYGNGYWCAVIEAAHKHIADEDYYGGYVGYITNPANSWSSKKIMDSVGDGYPRYLSDVEYLNGYFVARENYQGRNRYAYIQYTTSANGTWTRGAISKTTILSAGEGFNAIGYFDGNYILGNNTSTEVGMWSGKYNTTAGIYYSPTLDASTWTEKILWTNTNAISNSDRVNHINVLNGILFVCGNKYDTATSTSYAHISVASSINDLIIE